jgi:lysozyme
MASANALNIIKEFEGCKLTSYQDVGGTWTIGYGHTKGVTETDIISSAQAEALLVKELKQYENYVRKLVKVPLFQYQFDALVSWTYNLGPTNLKNSTMLMLLNKGRYDLIPNEMRRWNKVNGKVLEGLVIRRDKEARLFAGDI